MTLVTRSPKGSRAAVNRFTISPSYIIKNEPSLGAGVEIKVRAERLRLTLGFNAVISLDGAETISKPGVYTINRPVEVVRVRLAQFDGASVVTDGYFKHAPLFIDTYGIDVPLSEIDPDLLPCATFGLKSQTVGIGVTTVAIDTAHSDWMPAGATLINDPADLPRCLWIKQFTTWREAAGGLPPVAGTFIWRVKLSRTDNFTTEVNTILEFGNSTFGISYPLRNAMLPILSLLQPYAAETPNMRWDWWVSNSGTASAVTASLYCAYLR